MCSLDEVELGRLKSLNLSLNEKLNSIYVRFEVTIDKEVKKHVEL